MTFLQTRNRLVNFRVTPEELESLKQACLVLGSRNISDFARTAVLKRAEGQSEAGLQMDNRLARLDSKLGELVCAVQHLADLLPAGAGLESKP